MTTPLAAAISQRVWNYAHVLKDDGLAFMDYTEQITYLLFLKMAWEQREVGASPIPQRYSWGALLGISDNAKRLERYHQGLRKLSERSGLVGLIFTKPQSKINDPAKLNLLMQMIDAEQWSSLDVDVKGEVYEGLLARNAEDVRGGAGQYFTPRPVINAIVNVMRPELGMRICDPACGTGGFLVAAFEYLAPRAQTHGDRLFLRDRTFRGVDLVPNVARLCAMNLFLHGIGTDASHPVVAIGDSLDTVPTDFMDMVLTNPPFGRKSSFTIIGADGRGQTDKLSYARRDFWTTTSNKQFNFVQHVVSLLKDGGRAAMVVPDNVLFEGGAGERIRRELLKRCDVHTLLRLPTGIFYSAGVKANVLFFEKNRRSHRTGTTELWVYDLRSGNDFSLRRRPIRSQDLTEFVQAYRPDDLKKRREGDRFRRIGITDILLRDKASLDIQWQHSAPAPHEDTPAALMRGILEDLQEAMREFTAAESVISTGSDDA